MEERKFYLRVHYMLLLFASMSPHFFIQTEARHINHIQKHPSIAATTKPRSLTMLDSYVNYDDVMEPTETTRSSPFCTNPTVTPLSPTVTTAPPTPTQPNLTPPRDPPSPPRDAPSPPNVVPVPVFTPGTPVFLPPIVYPPPFGPPPPRTKQVLWCVAKPAVPDPIIQEAMDYACGAGADCSPVKSNGQCYQPNTVISHASYAFNSYWQNLKETGATCDFGGAAVLVSKDPSYDNCHFKMVTL